MQGVTIVVFGELNSRRILTAECYRRVLGAVELFNSYTQGGYAPVDIICLGGVFAEKQKGFAVSSAMRTRILFENPSIPPSAVKVEMVSVTTAENIEELHRNFSEFLNDRIVMYVTSGYHVPRVRWLTWWMFGQWLPKSAFLRVGTTWQEATVTQKLTELIGIFFPLSDVIIRKLRKHRALSQNHWE